MFIDYPVNETSAVLTGLLFIAGIFIYHRKKYTLFPFEQNLQKKWLNANKKLLLISLNLIALSLITAIGFY
jgi:hypothetical protein